MEAKRHRKSATAALWERGSARLRNVLLARGNNSISQQFLSEKKDVPNLYFMTPWATSWVSKMGMTVIERRGKEKSNGRSGREMGRSPEVCEKAYVNRYGQVPTTKNWRLVMGGHCMFI